jgi:predicted nucleotidyltransferase
MDEHSDIEILVDLESANSLLDLGGFLYNLQELLGAEIDVVTKRGLRP